MHRKALLHKLSQEARSQGLKLAGERSLNISKIHAEDLPKATGNVSKLRIS